MNTKRDAVYRIDRFRVPEGSMTEFMETVRETHAILAKQEGFVRDYLLEQASANGIRVVLTFVEWMTERSYAAAVERVKEFRRNSSVDPKKLIERLGVDAEYGDYHSS
jgi:heme-degrading monooxygenase HmoA